MPERQASLRGAARAPDSEPVFVTDSWSPEAADVQGARRPVRCPGWTTCRGGAGPGACRGLGAENSLPFTSAAQPPVPRNTQALPLPAPVCPPAAPSALLLPARAGDAAVRRVVTSEGLFLASWVLFSPVYRWRRELCILMLHDKPWTQGKEPGVYSVAGRGLLQEVPLAPVEFQRACHIPEAGPRSEGHTQTSSGNVRNSVHLVIALGW